MKTAADVLTDYVALPHGNPDAAVAMFSPDGTLEAPYFASFGLPWRFQGHQALRGTYAHLYGLYPDLRFENLRLVCATNDVAVGEYEFIARSAKTGRTVHQLSSVTLVVRAGQITLLREFQNIAEIALAIFPRGLHDIEIPNERSLAVGRYAPVAGPGHGGGDGAPSV